LASLISVVFGRSDLGKEGSGITRFTLPVCEDPDQIAFHVLTQQILLRSCR